MAKNQTRRLTPKKRESDIAVLSALRAMGGYAPRKDEASVGNLQDALTNAAQAQELKTQADAAAKAARDNMVDAEWKYHNAVLVAKEQVIGQYGDDSNEAQAVGIKKKSERKTPARKPQPPANPN